MVKYYIEKISIEKIKRITCSMNFQTLILTEDGYIKIIKDDYVSYYLQNKDPKIIENFVDNRTLYIDESIFKKGSEICQIPVLHKKVKIKYVKYKLNPKYKIQFVKEIVDNQLVDYYFLNEENMDVFQNVVFTFLKTLN
jgi:bisphosphoglycerate-independent phosphoglycerate mutase (AlkP superfamily)